MRYTRKYIDARFARAMDAIGAPHGEAWTLQPDGTVTANVGTHFIDHNPIYGGYAIERIVNAGGGEQRPFGDRHPAAEFVALLDGIIGAAQYMKEKM